MSATGGLRGPRRVRTRLGRALRAGAAAASLVLLGACASMPGSGKVEDVTRGNESQAEDQPVRVFGVPPQRDESPKNLVDGFLEAVTSDEPEYQTARKYLTAEAAARWSPTSGIKVVESFPGTISHPVAPEGATATVVDVTGQQVASVDGEMAYQPAPAQLAETFELRRNADGQWRIDKLPDGLLLSRADFRRIYKSVSLYWYASPWNTPLLVPDPIYLRSRVTPTTTLVEKLLKGPTKWLSPVVRSSFPANTSLVNRAVNVDDTGAVSIQLSDEARQAPAAQCLEMASQVLYTLGQVTKVESVELTTHRGPKLCSQSKQGAQQFDPALPQTTPVGYYVAKGAVNSLAANSTQPAPLPGPFGDGSLKLSEIAVARQGRQIAGIDQSDTTLYVGLLDSVAGVEQRAKAGSDRTFFSPTWDGRGGLWTVERNSLNSTTRVLWVDKEGTIPVTLEGFENSRVTGLRISPDGTRAALLLDERQLVIGRVIRGVDPVRKVVSTVTIDAPRVLLPNLVSAKSVSWNGANRLVVLGTQEQGSMQPQFVDVDGGNTVGIAAVSGIEAIAAPDGADQPLLARSSDRNIYRLEPGNTWKAIREGEYPTYPG